MLKLNYKLTHTFTGRDIKDAAMPDLIYKARIHHPPGWYDAVLELIESEWDNTEAACKILDGVIISITQDSEVIVFKAQELLETVETQNPKMGDGYIQNLAWQVYQYQKDFEDNRLKNLPEPLPQSVNGKQKLEEKATV